VLLQFESMDAVKTWRRALHSCLTFLSLAVLAK
jgi:hypothetical protein